MKRHADYATPKDSLETDVENKERRNWPPSHLKLLESGVARQLTLSFELTNPLQDEMIRDRDPYGPAQQLEEE